MRLLGLVAREAWRSAVEAASASILVSLSDDAARARSLASETTFTIIVVEREAFPDVEPAQLGAAPRAPAFLYLCDGSRSLGETRALFEDPHRRVELLVDPEPEEISRRIVDLASRIRGAREREREADVLDMLTHAGALGFRIWEYDMRAAGFTMARPAERPTANQYTLEELERSTWEKLYPEASRKKLRASIRDQLAAFTERGERIACPLDLEMMNADGTMGHRTVTTRLALDAEGRPTLLRGATWDTTEAMRTATSLASVEVEYKRLFDGAHDAILVLDPSGTILEANPRGCELYGCAYEDLVGNSIETYSVDPVRASNDLARGAEGAGQGRFETLQRRADGVEMTVEVNASSIEYRGRPAILAVSRDVTERRAEERARQDRERALSDATRLEAIGRLAGGIAHDFNNLLMVIEGCAEALAGATESEEITDLRDAVERAKTLVRQLLTFARKAPVEMRTLSIVEVVRPLIGMLRRLLREDIELVTQLDVPEATSVRADPSQLEQVVINLIVNARDAISGAGHIRLALTPSAVPGHVDLVVGDTGAGMDDATRSRVFEPFFSTKRGQNSGLGLATVHGIVAALGGLIEVTSELGVGTEMRVSLPAVAVPELRAISDRPQRNSHPGAETILLVEDERAVRRILARELERFGYRVIESENGAEALDLAAGFEGRIDLLVTDVVMPKLGGSDLAQRLLAARPDIKVLFMSGHMERETIQTITDKNLGPVLSKPFAPALLMEMVRRLCGAAEE